MKEPRARLVATAGLTARNADLRLAAETLEVSTVISCAVTTRLSPAVV